MRKKVLDLGKSPTERLDDTTLIAEAEYSINFSKSQKKRLFCLHYNGSNSFLFPNAAKIYYFKAKDSEMKNIYLVFREYFKGFQN